MDTETGEFLCEMDRETGENRSWGAYLNTETGEDECSKKPFRISDRAGGARFRLSAKKRIESSETLSQFIKAVVFLVPTAIVFTPLLGLFVLTSACFLHRWSHRQNRKLKMMGDYSIYYRNPLHALSKEFCHLCMEESRIIKLPKASPLLS
ncbi:uncharacterized protein LOC132698287 [Cylas formicarius]|uniref:uncharacterized protein LOC132698287 n=1 Tax=Cylas formicarius TaxID=197179 RepID=UPI002958D569|nr:uncharacterized protein LOC132698287 [Cylas formicarius]